MENLHKFYNHENIPWINLLWNAYYSENTVPQAAAPKGSFWWRYCLGLNDLFRGLASCTASDGKIMMLWKDIWNDSIMQSKYPELHSFAKDDNISMFQASNAAQNNFYDLFQFSLSVRHISNCITWETVLSIWIALMKKIVGNSYGEMNHSAPEKYIKP